MGSLDYLRWVEAGLIFYKIFTPELHIIRIFAHVFERPHGILLVII